MRTLLRMLPALLELESTRLELARLRRRIRGWCRREKMSLAQLEGFYPCSRLLIEYRNISSLYQTQKVSAAELLCGGFRRLAPEAKVELVSEAKLQEPSLLVVHVDPQLPEDNPQEPEVQAEPEIPGSDEPVSSKTKRKKKKKKKAQLAEPSEEEKVGPSPSSFPQFTLTELVTTPKLYFDWTIQLSLEQPELSGYRQAMEFVSKRPAKWVRDKQSKIIGIIDRDGLDNSLSESAWRGIANEIGNLRYEQVFVILAYALECLAVRGIIPPQARLIQ